MAEGGLIALNVLRLAESMGRALLDMRGLAYRLDEADGRVRKVGQPGGAFPMRAGIRFSGFLNGEYAIYLRVETAARLGGRWSAGQGLSALEAAREESECLAREVMNSAVGAAIRELERSAGGLDFEPATVGYREAAPDPGSSGAPWGDLLILGEAGPILRCFFLDAPGGGDAG